MLPLGGSLNAIVPVINAIKANIGVIRKPQRQLPASIDTPEPTMNPNPLLKRFYN